MGFSTMCHKHKPIDLIAERYADTDAEDEAEEDAAETPTLTPPADD